MTTANPMTRANPIGCCKVQTPCCPDALPEQLTATVISQAGGAEVGNSMTEFVLHLDDLEYVDDQVEQALWRVLGKSGQSIPYIVRGGNGNRQQAAPEMWLKCDGARWLLGLGACAEIRASPHSNCAPLNLEFVIPAATQCFPQIANDILIVVTT